MAVTLRLAGTSQTKLLAAGTLSIGRGPGNDWVLPDPERHLSKTHCVISIENGRAVLTDLSTNGVHINGARQATARDSRVVLTDGDTVRLGDYTISVTEVEDARDLDPFAGGARTSDPFDAPVGPAEGRSPLDIDPLDDPLGRPPDPAFRHPVAHRPLGKPLEDPFDVAEDKARRPIDPDDDLFRGVQPSMNWQGPAQPDNVDAPRQAYSAPRVLPTTDPSAIDFDALIGDIEPAAAPPSRRPSPAPPTRPGPDPFAELDSLLPAEPARDTLPPKPAASPQPARDPFADLEPPIAAAARPLAVPPDPFADLGPPAPTPAPPPAAADPFAEPARPAPPAPAPVPAAASSADAQAVLRAFLEGAGVSNLASSGDPAETMRAVGQVFRAMTEGLREVLMSRAAIKGDMRVEQTMIQARNNNPLKFSVTVDDAVSALLHKDRPGYMPPLAATKEAFHDIKQHELAVMAGVQTALMGLLQRFDPAALEKRMAQGLLASVLPAARKARYWDSFREVYGQIAREAEDDFQAVFGRAFAKAYTAQTRKDE